MIVEDGLRRMIQDEEDVFYYVTLHNENYAQPPVPSDDVREGVLKGLYLFRPAAARKDLHVTLFGSGSILKNALEAQECLEKDFGISADVWSATSYQQLRREALKCDRWNRLHPTQEQPCLSYLEEKLADMAGPVIAVSDQLKLVPDQIMPWVDRTFVPLGTDGFGMSDTREALRRHFEIDAPMIAVAALDALREDGHLDADTVAQAIEKLGIDTEKLDPLDV